MFSEPEASLVPYVAVDAFALERRVGHVAFHLLGLPALGTLDCLFAHLGHLHFHDKVMLAFLTGMIVLGHNVSSESR